MYVGAIAMFGILMDVSGSTKEAYDVEHTHVIITSIMNIVKKEVTPQESIFVSAFGLDIEGEKIEKCDLLTILLIMVLN